MQLSENILNTENLYYSNVRLHLDSISTETQVEIENVTSIGNIDNIYKELYGSTSKRQTVLGQFHTPQQVRDIVLGSLPGNFIEKISKGHRLIDPSCGTGNFLIGVVKLAITYFKNQGILNIYDAVNELIIPNICGSEVDPVLIKAITINFKTEFDNKIHEPTVYHVDSLGLFDEESSTLFTNKFDYVVGNPPWVEAKDLPVLIKKSLQSKYPVSNLYGAFILRGLKFLRKSGYLSYVVPRSFTGGRYYYKLRNYLANRTCVKEISYYSERNQKFHGGDVLQELVVISTQNSIPAKNHLVVCKPCSDINDYKSHKGFYVSQSQLFSNHDLIMLLASSKEEFIWIHNISSLPNFEEHGFRFSTGQIVAHRAKDFLKDEETEEAFPIIYSHNILNDESNFSFDLTKKAKNKKLFATITGYKNYDGKKAQINKVHDRKSSIEKDLNSYSEIIICRRRSHRGDKRRFVGLYIGREQLPEKYFLDNSLNFIAINETSAKPPPLKAVANLLRSDFFENFFSVISSNTQLNKNDFYLFGFPELTPETESLYKSLENLDINETEKINTTTNKLFESVDLMSHPREAY